MSGRQKVTFKTKSGKVTFLVKYGKKDVIEEINKLYDIINKDSSVWSRISEFKVNKINRKIRKIRLMVKEGLNSSSRSQRGED